MLTLISDMKLISDALYALADDRNVGATDIRSKVRMIAASAESMARQAETRRKAQVNSLMEQA